MKFIKLFHFKERAKYIDSLSLKTYMISGLKAFGVTLFLAFAPITVLINMIIILFLYKSFWAIIIGAVLVYFIVLCIWHIDKLFLKYANIEELQVFNKDYFKFYNMIATVLTVAAIIFLSIEVI